MWNVPERDSNCFQKINNPFKDLQKSYGRNRSPIHALYDWDQDGVPERRNSGLAPYRDETRNVLFSALTDGYSTEVFYVIADNDLSAKPETLFGAQYIDTGDDQPGEWKVTDGPADQELYDLFRASYGDEPDFDSCRIHFYALFHALPVQKKVPDDHAW